MTLLWKDVDNLVLYPNLFHVKSGQIFHLFYMKKAVFFDFDGVICDSDATTDTTTVLINKGNGVKK